MPSYTISETEVFSQDAITTKMFGTNFVTSFDFDLVEDANLIALLGDLNIDTLRFPGGSVTESIFTEATFLTGKWNANVHVARDGSMSSLTPLSDFFDVAGTIGANIQLVIPTKVAFAETLGQALASGTYGQRTALDPNYFEYVRRFVDHSIDEAYASGTSITGLEIGNEFWGSGQMTAGEYGWLAGQLIDFLDAEYPDLDLLVQTAASANEFSPATDRAVLLEPDGFGDFIVHLPSDIDGPVPNGWSSGTLPGSGIAMEQLDLIARQIRQTDGAAEAIDGIVGHVYFDAGFDGIDSQRDFALERVPLIFADRLGVGELDFHVTEWSARNPLGTNVDGNLGNANGLHYAHTTVEAFFELVSQGVDSANFWPVTFGSSTSDNRVLIDTDEFDLTFGGIIFRWLSESTAGMQAFFDFEVEDEIDIHGFGEENDLTIFVAERSGIVQTSEFARSVSIDLGQFAPNEQSTVVISRLHSDDGSIFSDEANPIMSYSSDEMEIGETIEVDLLPWEIVRIEVRANSSDRGEIARTPDSSEAIVVESARVIQGTTANESLTGGSGDDTLNGGGGDDNLHGGDGDDRLVGAQGDDTAYGGLGNDVLVGDHGNEALFGNEGNDTLRSWAGVDHLDGGDGNDTFIVSPTAGSGFGFAALNIGNTLQIGTRSVVSLENHQMFSSFVEGGAGFDVLQLSSGSDAFFLHDGYTEIHSHAAAVLNEEGISPSLRFRGIERIEAGAGDDIIDLTSDLHYLADNGLVVTGDSGNDTIWGSHLNEVILGGTGDDVIFGGAGNDSLSGGSGADIFEFTWTSTASLIVDFNPGEGDVLRFYNRGNVVFDEESAELTNGGFSIGYWNDVQGVSERLFVDLGVDEMQLTADALNAYLSAIDIII